MHPLRVLPGEQYLRCRPGRHGELAADGHGVAQTGWTLGGGHADAVLALAPEELGGFAGDVAQPGQHRTGGSQQPVLTGRGGQLAQAGAEHEPALHVASHQPVVLERDGEPVSRRPGQSRRRHESGQGRRSGLECGQNESCFVENADSARVVHETILPSRIVERKSLIGPIPAQCWRE